MAKEHNKQSMAEDYLSRVEWESTHPLDRRGRPFVKYQPNWKYKRVYPRTSKSKAARVLIGTIVAIGLIFLVFSIFIEYPDNTGVAIVSVFVLLSFLVTIYFMVRGPK